MPRLAPLAPLALILLAGAAAAQGWGEDDGFADGDPPASREPPTDDGWGGPADDGFGAERSPDPWPAVASPPPALAPPPAGDHRLTLAGFARRDEAVWVERFSDPTARPYAKLRHSLDLDLGYAWRRRLQVKLAGHLEHDLAYTVAQGYDPEQVAAYERRFLHGEQFVRLSLGAFDITLGRQIVAWGEGDALSVLDVVNPRDNREPGLADLDDLRLAVLASRITWSAGAHRVELMGLHEGYFGEFAPPLADYSPFRALVASDPVAAALIADKRVRFRHTPDRTPGGAHMALARWTYRGEGLDLGLYAASVLDRTGVVRLPPLSPALLTARSLDLTLDHLRYTLLGTSGATTAGAWLFKWELAGELDRAFNAGDPEARPLPALRVARGNTLQTMAAVGYAGISDVQLFLEVQKGFLLSGPDDLLLPIEAPIAALRAQWSLLRERLRLQGALTGIGARAQRGWLARGEARYVVGDGFSVAAGYVHYQPGASAADFGPFHGFDAHDRLFTQVRYDFAVGP